MNRIRQRHALALLVLTGALFMAGGNTSAYAAGAPVAPTTPSTSATATMNESDLYKEIANDPSNIKLLVFKNGEDKVLVLEKDKDNPVEVTISDGTAGDLHEKAVAAGIAFKSEGGPGGSSGGGGFLAILPTLLIFGLIIFFVVRFSKAQKAAGQQNAGIGKSRHKKFDTSKPSVKFQDVAGQEEAKEELAEIVEFLRNPRRFRAMGARIPRGVLLIGPPGNGKTLFAKAVAGESGATFYSVSGSNFVELYVGVGAARVRDLFNEAKANGPAIIFIDEIDSIGRHRSSGTGGGSHEEREQTLNQVLVEMDGFEGSDNVIVLAATNRADMLDAALVRPGRFDRQVLVDRPDKAGRLGILQVHSKGKPLASDVNLETVAAMTPGFSGADLANVCNEAAILATRRGLSLIGMPEFDEGIARTTLGVARSSRAQAMSPELKRQIAYHEGGHAVVSHRIKGGSPIGKLTIMPRSRALGYAQTMASDDQFTKTQEQLLADIAMALGGRAGDELFSRVTHTGASNDFQQAYAMARRMVCEFGMSRLGPIAVGEGSNPFPGQPHIGSSGGIGPHLADAIDAEVSRIIAHCDALAREILEADREMVERLVDVLMEKETVLAAEFRELMGDHKVDMPPLD